MRDESVWSSSPFVLVDGLRAQVLLGSGELLGGGPLKYPFYFLSALAVLDLGQLEYTVVQVSFVGNVLALHPYLSPIAGTLCQTLF